MTTVSNYQTETDSTGTQNSKLARTLPAYISKSIRTTGPIPPALLYRHGEVEEAGIAVSCTPSTEGPPCPSSSSARCSSVAFHPPTLQSRKEMEGGGGHGAQGWGSCCDGHDGDAGGCGGDEHAEGGEDDHDDDEVEGSSTRRFDEPRRGRKVPAVQRTSRGGGAGGKEEEDAEDSPLSHQGGDHGGFRSDHGKEAAVPSQAASSQGGPGKPQRN